MDITDTETPVDTPGSTSMPNDVIRYVLLQLLTVNSLWLLK